VPIHALELIVIHIITHLLGDTFVLEDAFDRGLCFPVVCGAI